jgi:ABC-type transport system involved in multi-copper enzyme maturation permease subunit
MRGLARFETRAILRGRWATAATVALAVVATVITITGLESFQQLGLGSIGPAAVGLLNLALLLPTGQALLMAAMTVASNREGGLYAMARARGVRSSRLVASAWWAATLSAWTSIAGGFGLVAFILALNVPLADLTTFAALIAVSMTAAATAAGLGALVGTLVATRLQAAMLGLGSWFAWAIGLDLIVLGLGVFSQLGATGLVMATVANPLQAGRILALLAFDASATILGPVGAFLVDTAGQSLAAFFLAGVMVAWTVATIWLGATVLRRRDL